MLLGAIENDKKLRSSLAEMKILMTANKSGDIKSMTTFLFKELITSEILKLKLQEDRTDEKSNDQFHQVINEKFKNFKQQTKENSESIMRILEIVKKIKEKQDKSKTSKQTILMKRDQNTQTLFEYH